MGVCSSLRGSRDSRQNRDLARAVRPQSIVNVHCNHDAQVEFGDSITLLAPQWGSAVHFGGGKIRARIALPLGAVQQKSMLNLHRNHHAHAELDDGITLLVPQWGSAVHFGGAKIRARIALPLGAVRQKSMLKLHRNHHAYAELVDSIALLAPQWGSAVHFGGVNIRAGIALPLGSVRQRSMLNLHRNHHSSRTR